MQPRVHTSAKVDMTMEVFSISCQYVFSFCFTQLSSRLVFFCKSCVNCLEKVCEKWMTEGHVAVSVVQAGFPLPGGRLSAEEEGCDGLQSCFLQAHTRPCVRHSTVKVLKARLHFSFIGSRLAFALI